MTNGENKMSNTETSKIHPFQKAGLGTAPFRLDRFEVRKHQACHGAPVQPGTCCDYCGTGIMLVYWIRSSEGNEFKVGSSCVEKTTDTKLIKAVKTKAQAYQAKTAKERKLAKIEILRASLADAAIRTALKNFPHPKGWEGKTLLDFADWMLTNAGIKGKSEAAKQVEWAVNNSEEWIEENRASIKAQERKEKQDRKDRDEAHKQAIEEAKARKANSQWVGEIKERIEFTATINWIGFCEGYRYGTERTIYHLQDKNGDEFVWFCSGYDLKIEDKNSDDCDHLGKRFVKKGDEICIKGTIKSHSEYKGTKQTVLTRCKLVD